MLMGLLVILEEKILQDLKAFIQHEYTHLNNTHMQEVANAV